MKDVAKAEDPNPVLSPGRCCLELGLQSTLINGAVRAESRIIGEDLDSVVREIFRTH